MPFNVNKRTIENYLRDEADERRMTHGEDYARLVASYLLCALLTPLCKELAKQDAPNNLLAYRSLPLNAPQWLTTAFNEGHTVYQFDPGTDMFQDICHVADWILAAIENDEAWLKDVDQSGNPKKLNKIGSLEQAKKEADKAMLIYSQKAAAKVYKDSEGHEETVKTFPNGYRIVKLLTPKALDKESAFLGHCVGNGGYDEQLRAGTHSFYSLRDKNGKSHATLEVETISYFNTARDFLRHIFGTNIRSGFGTLLQCKGKQNKPPVEKYMPYIQDFIREHNFNLNEKMAHTGLILQDGVYYDINNLPNGFYYDGDLDFSKTHISGLPEEMEVTGHLNLRDTKIDQLPDKLRVGGILNLCNTGITTLPEDLWVGSHICMPNGKAVTLEVARRLPNYTSRPNPQL